MTKEQTNQATQLQLEGYSLRDIGAQLGVDKNAVDRALKKEPPLAGAVVPTTELIKRGITSEAVELGKLDLTLSHEREMAKLNLRQEELTIQRRQVELDGERVNNDKKLLALREEQGVRELQAEEERVTAQQELFVNKFNRLLRELLKNCVDSTWSEPDVDDYLNRVKSLRIKVSKFCDNQAIEEEELALHHNLKELTKLIEQTKENDSHFFNSDVDFDYDKNQIQVIKSWLVDTFDKAYKKPAKKSHSNDGSDEEDPTDGEDNDVDNSVEGEEELLSTFNELLSELIDNCDDTEWEVSECNDYQNRVEAFQAKLLEFIDELEDDFNADQQCITVNTQALLEIITDREIIKDENNETVTLSATNRQKRVLEALQIDDFWDEIEPLV